MKTYFVIVSRAVCVNVMENKEILRTIVISFFNPVVGLNPLDAYTNILSYEKEQ